MESMIIKSRTLIEDELRAHRNEEKVKPSAGRIYQRRMGKAKGKSMYARRACGGRARTNKNRLPIINALLLMLFVFRMNSVGEQLAEVR